MARIHYDLQTRKTQNLLNEQFNETTTVVDLDFTEFTYKEVKNVQGMDRQTLIGKINVL